MSDLRESNLPKMVRRAFQIRNPSRRRLCCSLTSFPHISVKSFLLPFFLFNLYEPETLWKHANHQVLWSLSLSKLEETIGCSHGNSVTVPMVPVALQQSPSLESCILIQREVEKEPFILLCKLARVFDHTYFLLNYS